MDTQIINIGQMGIDLKTKAANAIKRYLEKNDLSVTQLSKAIGVPDNTIGRILKKKNTNIETIEEFLDAIGVTMDDLRG